MPILLSAAASAQAPSSGIKDVPEIDQPIVRTTVTNIVAPVLVKDKEGNIVDGLQPNQFHLFDNGKEQNIQVDQTFEPISLVVAIECSSRIEAILRQIKPIGSLNQQTVIGTQGEAAIIAFDGRLRLMQDFTNDPDKLKVAVDKIQAGNAQSRMIDAVDRGVYMLRKRPRDNRKIVLLISETRDEGSETRLREALIDTNLSNVLVYSVDITQLAVRLTEKRPDPRPVAMDPTTMNAPLGIPNTPTTMEQNYGMGNRVQFTPLIKEIYTDAKGIFVKDPSTQFARQTGAQQFYFLKQKGLEEAVQEISRQLHSQYMLSYRPTNKEEGGFHTIEVSIDRSNLICVTRPGYWIGGGAQ
ncbi:MAG: VWA domain-containing protein [Acidobacteriota bacterium]|nr:VWA domain-containing protein [Acidobacteriota bacterium]